MKNSVVGDRELAMALRELAQGVSVSDVDKAAKVSMDPMKDDAKARARRYRNRAGKYPGFPDPRPGRMHVDQGIVFGREKNSTRTRRRYVLGGKGRARKLLHLLEFGTLPHFQKFFRGGFHHPGAQPKPVMTPAYESHADDIETLFGKQLWRVLSAKVLSLGRKRRR